MLHAPLTGRFGYITLRCISLVTLHEVRLFGCTPRSQFFIYYKNIIYLFIIIILLTLCNPSAEAAAALRAVHTHRPAGTLPCPNPMSAMCPRPGPGLARSYGASPRAPTAPLAAEPGRVRRGLAGHSPRGAAVDALRRRRAPSRQLCAAHAGRWGAWGELVVGMAAGGRRRWTRCAALSGGRRSTPGARSGCGCSARRGSGPSGRWRGRASAAWCSNTRRYGTEGCVPTEGRDARGKGGSCEEEEDVGAPPWLGSGSFMWLMVSGQCVIGLCAGRRALRFHEAPPCLPPAEERVVMQPHGVVGGSEWARAR